MRVHVTDIPDVLVLEPTVFGDQRGYFFESYNRRVLADVLGRDATFVQDNQSRSARGVLRGLHYQVQNTQGKLVRVLSGEIFDAVVDIRRSSVTFGRWVGVHLSADNHRQLWVPEGFAHGFLVLSESAEVFYKTTDYYAPEHERCIRWDDPALDVRWPLAGEPVLSRRDAEGVPLGEAELLP